MRAARRTTPKELRHRERIIPEDLLPQLDHLKEIVLEKAGLNDSQLLGKCRKRAAVDARFAFSSMALRYCRYVKTEIHNKPYRRQPTLNHIGAYLNRDHSSIHFGVDQIDHLLKYDKKFDRLYTSIELKYTGELLESRC